MEGLVVVELDDPICYNGCAVNCLISPSFSLPQRISEFWLPDAEDRLGVITPVVLPASSRTSRSSVPSL